MATQARFLSRLGACLIITAGLVYALPAAARHGPSEMAQAAETGPVFEWIMLDAETGQVLSEQNADVLTYPASLTKMMTLYLTFEALNQSRIRLDQSFYVSAEAASRAPSKLALTPGDSVPVRDLILGVVTKSANDAASVLAEGLAGSETNFAQYMTAKARQLGMEHTWYRNASGLPDPYQRTTARDIARLSLALYHQFPREYRYFSTQQFDFRGVVVHSHNHLLEWYQGADGIKTGFVNASGFNLAASAVRDGRRLIGVIMGGRSARSRDAQMASLLDQGFAYPAVQPQPVAPQAPLQPQPVAPAPQPQDALVATVASPPPAPRSIAAAAMVAPAAMPASAGSAPRSKPASALAAGAADLPGTHQKSGFLRDVAATALRHLSPVAKAEASPLLTHETSAGGADWAIQLGAFRGEAAAQEATSHLAGIATLKGKPHQVVAPAKHDSDRLYRARVLHLTAKGAQAACAELHRKGIACSVVHPAGEKLASSN